MARCWGGGPNELRGSTARELAASSEVVVAVPRRHLKGRPEESGLINPAKMIAASAYMPGSRCWWTLMVHASLAWPSRSLETLAGTLALEAAWRGLLISPGIDPRVAPEGLGHRHLAVHRRDLPTRGISACKPTPPRSSKHSYPRPRSSSFPVISTEFRWCYTGCSTRFGEHEVFGVAWGGT